jgi:hypothetical protein
VALVTARTRARATPAPAPMARWSKGRDSPSGLAVSLSCLIFDEDMWAPRNGRALLFRSCATKVGAVGVGGPPRTWKRGALELIRPRRP